MKPFLFVFVIAIPAIAGCQQVGWDNVPGAQVRPESLAADVSNDQWRDEVMTAMATWTTRLDEAGCVAPFVMSSDNVGDHRVELVANADWTWDGVDGVTFGDAPTQPAGSISVRTGPDDPIKAVSWRYAVLVHELGHALGLGHADPANGQSIMTPFATTSKLTDWDVAGAACALGCGPCGDTPDPYDGVDGFD